MNKRVMEDGDLQGGKEEPVWNKLIRDDGVKLEYHMY